jgi:predicted transcriptional regulator
MSQVVSLRLPDSQAKRLQRQARRLGRTPSETGRLLIEEALRQIEFAHIEFRDSAAGRQAYIRGRRVQIWTVVMIARGYANDVKKTARHLEMPQEWVQSAFNYAEAFPDEIRNAIEDNHRSFEELKRKLPSLARSVAPARGAARK